MKATLEDVRRWAWSRGIPVHTTGSLPRTVIEAYNKVHPDAKVRIPFDDVTYERIARAGRSGARSRYKKEHA